MPIPGCATVTSPWVYEGYARDLVLGLKLRGRRGAARPLAAAISRALAEHRLPTEVVTWIPARRRDASERGLDHAEAIARRVAATLGLPAARLLSWADERVDQATLDRAARKRNLAGAFRARRVTVPVLVIDDVVTTGATLAAAAHGLAIAGAPRVDVAAACTA